MDLLVAKESGVGVASSGSSSCARVEGSGAKVLETSSNSSPSKASIKVSIASEESGGLIVGASKVAKVESCVLWFSSWKEIIEIVIHNN